jgi:5-methylcytosine-specific restriction endonuclease McrA
MKVRRLGMEPLSQVNNDEISIDFSCVNCDQMFVVSTRPSLYCSPRCQQNAKFVRYFRGCIRDGRIKDPLVREAIQLKLAFAYSERGYYDEKARKVPLILRSRVIEREQGSCRKCGAVGSEIDHIEGDSNTLDNLQLLCRDCHSQKTKANIVLLTPEHPRYEEIQSREKHLRFRVEASTATQPCDDEINWNITYRQIIAGQRQILKEIREDVEGRSRQRVQTDEHLVAQELSELSELHAQIEALELQKQARIDEILTPEIKSKLDAVESEFAGLIRSVEENIQVAKERIKPSVLRFEATVKGTSLQVVYYKGRVSWDTKSLDAYAMSHPEILQFRKQGKPTVSFRRINKDKRKV